MKTPEELAIEFAKDMWWKENGYRRDVKDAWLDGYRTAKQHEEERNSEIKSRWMEIYDRLTEEENK
jgi:hypothetical protein